MSTTQLRTVDTAPGPGRVKNITVLGAGVAGLTAAHELERLGHRVEVLEASRRVGGRIRTHRFSASPDAPFAELGAMRIPMNHTRTLHYVAKLGLLDQIREFHTLFSDDDDFLQVETGRHIRVREAPDDLVGRYRARLGDHRHRDNTLLFGSWLNACMSAIAPREFRDRLDDHTTDLLDLVDAIDLGPYFCGEGRTKLDLQSVFTDHPHLRAAMPEQQDRFLDDVLLETSCAIVRLRGGSDTLTDKLAAKLRGPIRLGHEVLGLSVQDDEVLVQIRNGGRVFTERCDYVVCTIPFPVLRTLRLDGFDEDKLSSVHETEYWPATKIAYHCREPFWQADGITGGASFTGGLVRQTYYPPAVGDPSLGAVLLASYTIGPDADELAKLDPVRRRAIVFDEVCRMHPGLREPGAVLDEVSQAWGEHRWSRGAATIRWGQDTATREAEQHAAARPLNRLFFAGEHCSSKPAWIEGAIESAIDAVHGINWHQGDRVRSFGMRHA